MSKALYMRNATECTLLREREKEREKKKKKKKLTTQQKSDTEWFKLKKILKVIDY